MIAAVLVPFLVLAVAVLLERYEARMAPRETPRTRTDGVTTPATTPAAAASTTESGRHLRVVRDADAPAAPVLAGALPRAS